MVNHSRALGVADTLVGMHSAHGPSVKAGQPIRGTQQRERGPLSASGVAWVRESTNRSESGSRAWEELSRSRRLAVSVISSSVSNRQACAKQTQPALTARLSPPWVCSAFKF